MKVKKCNRCGEIKPLDCFYKSKAYASGVDNKCKDCRREMARLHRKNNPDAVSKSEKKRRQKHKKKRDAIKKKWCKENPERAKQIARAATKRWRKKNIAAARAYARKHAKENPDQYAAKAALRRARIARALPSWVSDEHKREIQKLYQDAKRLTEETGIAFHVDHIIPIAGRGVRGLHVPWNLRVVTAHENQTKWNHYGNETPSG